MVAFRAFLLGAPWSSELIKTDHTIFLPFPYYVFLQESLGKPVKNADFLDSLPLPHNSDFVLLGQGVFRF